MPMSSNFSKRTTDGAPLLFRLRVSENGLFLAISAPSVPFRGSFSQKGRGRGNETTAGEKTTLVSIFSAIVSYFFHFEQRTNFLWIPHTHGGLCT